MFDFISFGADNIQTLLLIILRTTGLFVIAPVIGHRTIPVLIRVGLIILLSLVLLSSLNLPVLPQAVSLWQLAGLALREMLVGFLIGFVFRLLFDGVHTAGSLVGYQMGFAIVTVFDSNLAGQVSMIGRFWYMLALVIFLSIDGHHLIISAFADSYKVIPPGGMGSDVEYGSLIIKLSAYIFIIALKIASPIMISLFLTDIALGTIAKTIPTMNVFFVGFPLKISIGLMMIAMSLPIFAYVLEKATGFLDHEMKLLMLAMEKA